MPTLEMKMRELANKKGMTRFFLRGLSHLYGLGIACRHFAYDRKLAPQKGVDIPVISVGNIVFGGTGKTPLTLLIAQTLLQDAKIAILSRGYLSKNENSGGVRCEGILPYQEFGDEPSWLALKLPEVAVYVGKDRKKSAEVACKEGANLIILDDGMQHRKFKRDFEIVVIDAKDPLGQGHFLPRGFLRDSPKRLKTARLIVATNFVAKEAEELMKALAPYTQAPIVGMQLKPARDENLMGKKVGVFCAIGNPQRFIETVKSLGGEIVGQMFGADHTPFDKAKLDVFVYECKEKGAHFLVCTEKDKVKLPRGLQTALPIHPVKVALDIITGEPHWRSFIEDVKRRIHERRS